MPPKKKVPAKKHVGSTDYYGGRLVSVDAKVRGQVFKFLIVEPPLPYVSIVFEDFGIHDMLSGSGLADLSTLGMNDNVHFSPLMVKEFYANFIEQPNYSFTTSVGNVSIDLNVERLSRLLSLPEDTCPVRTSKQYFEDENSFNVFEDQLKRFHKVQAGSLVKDYSISCLTPRARLLACLFVEYISGKNGHFNDLEMDCLEYVTGCFTDKKISLAQIIISKMSRVSADSNHLPYSLIICKICELLRVDLSLFPREEITKFFNLAVKKRKCLLTVAEEEETGVVAGKTLHWLNAPKTDKFFKLFDNLYVKYREIPAAVAGYSPGANKKRQFMSDDDAGTSTAGGADSQQQERSGDSYQVLCQKIDSLAANLVISDARHETRFDRIETAQQNIQTSQLSLQESSRQLIEQQRQAYERQIRSEELQRQSLENQRQLLEFLRSQGSSGFSAAGPSMGPHVSGSPTGGATFTSFLNTGVGNPLRSSSPTGGAFSFPLSQMMGRPGQMPLQPPFVPPLQPQQFQQAQQFQQPQQSQQYQQFQQFHQGASSSQPDDSADQ